MTKKFILPVVVLAGAMTLSGCQIMPKSFTPAAPIPANYPGGDGATVKPVADIGWNEFFQNPDLRETISAALNNNRDLKTAILRIEEARALYNIQRADQLPTVNTTGGLTMSRQLLAGTMRENTVYQVGLGMAAFELDFFGRVKNLSAAALSQYMATEEARRAFQISLVGEVAKAWLTERALAEQKQLAERAYKARESSRDLVKKRLDGGIANALEFQQSESLVQSARVSVLALRRQHALAMNALMLLTGSSIKPTPQTATLSNQLITADIGAGMPSDLLTYRPDIRAAEQRLLPGGRRQRGDRPRIGLELGACAEPRPQMCTMDYRPACGLRRDNSRKTYSNACSACADAQVVSQSAGACP